MRWKPIALTFLVYGGVLGGASIAAVYVFVRPNWPLMVLAFVGLFLAIVDAASGIGGPAAGVPDWEEDVMGELHDDSWLVTNLASVAPSIRPGVYGLGLLV